MPEHADSVRRYRKRPVVIEARQVNREDQDDLLGILDWCQGRAVGWDSYLIAIDTLEGTRYAGHGDWVIRGVKGEFYPCKPDIFDATYEPLDIDGCTCLPNGPAHAPTCSAHIDGVDHG